MFFASLVFCVVNKLRDVYLILCHQDGNVTYLHKRSLLILLIPPVSVTPLNQALKTLCQQQKSRKCSFTCIRSVGQSHLNFCKGEADFRQLLHSFPPERGIESQKIVIFKENILLLYLYQFMGRFLRVFYWFGAISYLV